MPHPERAQTAGALSRAVGGRWGERRDAALGGVPASAAVAEAEPAGPGLAIFAGLARHFGLPVDGA